MLLGLGLRVAQWAEMLGIHQRAAQRWERLNDAGPRVSSLVCQLSGSQRLMPPLVLLAPIAPAAQRGAPAVLLQIICQRRAVETRGQVKAAGSVTVGLALSSDTHRKLQAHVAGWLESGSRTSEQLNKAADAPAAVLKPSDD